MPAAGDDLRRYLIVPPNSSAPSTQPPPEQGASCINSESRPDTPRFHKSAKRKAEDVDMEVNIPTQPTKLASTNAGDATMTAPLEGVYNLDDFLATHQADHGAHVAASEAAKAPPTKKTKTYNASSPPQPVAVGARSSKHTILLHEKYQALAIPQPVFTFGGDSVTRFTVEVSFPGLANAEELQGLREEGRFNSKQEAKEAASKTALAILEDLERTGRVAKAGKAKKQKGEPAHHAPREKEEPGENYVGQLLEFQRSISAPQPTYTDYALGPRWSCLLEIDGHASPFGSLDALFGSKKLARQHAASCAVAHFKAEGQWPESFTDVGGIKKRKPTSPQDAQRPSTASTSTSPSSATASAPQALAALAIALNLGTPEYRFNPTDAADLHSVAVFFRNGGAHAGPLGEVRNVFGKKKAKDECARLALGYLTEVKEKREEVGLEGAVGKAMLGEGGVENKQKEGETSEDDELEIYEDAMEL